MRDLGMAFSALIVPLLIGARRRQGRLRRDGLLRPDRGARSRAADPPDRLRRRRSRSSRWGCCATGDLLRPSRRIAGDTRARSELRERSTPAPRSSARARTGTATTRSLTGRSSSPKAGARSGGWAAGRASGRSRCSTPSRAPRRSPRRSRRLSYASAARPSSPRCVRTPASRRLLRKSPGTCSAWTADSRMSADAGLHQTHALASRRPQLAV